MKLIKLEILKEAGAFSSGDEWKTIYSDVTAAVNSVVWPHGSMIFTIHCESGKKRGMGSGVKPIKGAFLRTLQERGWWTELERDKDKRKRARIVPLGGPVDAYKIVHGGKLFVVEWETGNISSSHRALNKMALGMLNGSCIGGILVLPTRDLYKHLTDRVGNYSEIQPYFPLYSNIALEDGLLAIAVVEHDAVSKDVPKIPKGTDGRAII